MKLSDYLLYYLKEAGVLHAFLITGGAVSNIVNSFDENKNIKYICTTHEQGAAIAAEAYSRITRNLGVAIATSGPGATNLLTGIACAYFDSIPTLYITGQVNTNESTWENFQETDIVSIARPITKYSVKIQNAEDIKYELDKAIYIAKSDRPGPVLIDIPMNIQRVEIVPENLKSFIPEKKELDEVLLNKKIDETIGFINSSKRPIFILGAGVKLAKAEKETIDLIEKLKIPVVASWGGIDIMPHNHELFVETFGVSAGRIGNFSVQNSDLIISLGSRLDTRQTGGKPQTFARGAKKVIVDVDKNELYKNRGINIDVDINFNIKDFLDGMYKNIHKIKTNDFSDWKDIIKNWKEKYPIVDKKYYEENKVNPYVFMETLSKESIEGDIITNDTGSNLSWAMQGLKAKKDQKIFSAFGNSPMGYSIAAAIGASVASGNKQVICITGDGGIKMNINELETIARYKLPIKIFVMNNHEFGLIKQFQDVWLNSCYKASSVSGGLGDPDFVRIAKAYDIDACSITSNKEIKQKIREILDFNGPYLCSVEIKCGEKVIPKLEFGKPIEDSSPLLDRDEFKKNMIVKPLD
jgi:acetolactate synthase I/II/III large subunit